jgi:riboflavin synthase
MFTGIIEATGTVTDILKDGANKTFWISSPLSNELTIDQSIAHSGACLTVEEAKNGTHRVTAIAETLAKTNLNTWGKGTLVNLERCLQMNGRLDGHMVQGHVDTTAQCSAVAEKAGSYEYRFSFDKKFAPLVIEKGSISVNGISLTIFNVTENAFTVAIIPYTFEHTDIKNLHVGAAVNIEFDMIGKYVSRFMQLRQNP